VLKIDEILTFFTSTFSLPYRLLEITIVIIFCYCRTKTINIYSIKYNVCVDRTVLSCDMKVDEQESYYLCFFLFFPLFPFVVSIRCQKEQII